jgi:hypothetical protein
MTKQEAYKIVFEDLIQEPIARGIYNKSDDDINYEYFMYGICTVMEAIAFGVSEECYEQFDYMFIYNMIESEKDIDDKERSFKDMSKM